MVANAADDADILLPQLLDRGWALFGEPLPAQLAGRLVVGSDRLQLLVRKPEWEPRRCLR